MYRCGSGCRVCPWFLVKCRIHWTSGAVTYCSPQSLQFESVCDCVGSVYFRVCFCVSVFVSSLVCTCPKVCVWQPRQNETGNPRDNRLRWPDARRHESEMKNTRKDTRKTKFVMRCETRWDKRWDEEDEHEREIVRYVDVCWCVCWWCVVVCVCLSVWVRRQKRQTQQEGDRKVTFLTPREIEKETCFFLSEFFLFVKWKLTFQRAPLGISLELSGHGFREMKRKVLWRWVGVPRTKITNCSQESCQDRTSDWNWSIQICRNFGDWSASTVTATRKSEVGAFITRGWTVRTAISSDRDWSSKFWSCVITAVNKLRAPASTGIRWTFACQR